MTGLAYVLMTLAGVLARSARGGLIVAGDAAATASNILAHPAAYQVNIAGEFLVVAFYIGVVALLYVLLKPVNHPVAVLATCFGLVACAIQAGACLLLSAPVLILSGPASLSAFSTSQVQALALLSLKLYSGGYGIALVFFAFYGLTIGYLVYHATFLPRFLGVLLMLGALAWLAYLSPALGASLFPYIAAGGVGELLLLLWLLIKGVDSARWTEQAERFRRPEPAPERRDR
jgi:hypothetical protein